MSLSIAGTPLLSHHDYLKVSSINKAHASDPTPPSSRLSPRISRAFRSTQPRMLTHGIYLDLEKNHGLRLGPGPLAVTSLSVNEAFVHGDAYLVPRGR